MLTAHIFTQRLQKLIYPNLLMKISLQSSEQSVVECQPYFTHQFGRDSILEAVIVLIISYPILLGIKWT